MVKHPTCLGVFDYFVGLALKGLTKRPLLTWKLQHIKLLSLLLTFIMYLPTGISQHKKWSCLFRDRLQISLLVLSELINFYPPEIISKPKIF